MHYTRRERSQAPHTTQRVPSWPVFFGILVVSLVAAASVVVVFPNLRDNFGFLALAVLTPPLAGLSIAVTRSGLRYVLPRPLLLVVRGALALIVVLDLVVFALPMFTGATVAHDAAPSFASLAAATHTAAPDAGASPTVPAAPAPRKGTFDHRAGPETVSGTAILGSTDTSAAVLRLEQLQATPGPDLFVYLSPVTSPTTADQVMRGLEVGKLKATAGETNYALPAGLDLGQFKAVVIYCKSFNVIFGYANLA